jgi:hypothetical protein
VGRLLGDPGAHGPPVAAIASAGAAVRAEERLLCLRVRASGQAVRCAGGPRAGHRELNARHDWTGVYGDDLNGVVGFAEDLFDGQFGEWQTRHRPLAPGETLFPVVPFVLGGDFTVDNVRPAADVKGMRFYGQLFRATSQVPDGGQARVDLAGLAGLAGLARILD